MLSLRRIAWPLVIVLAFSAGAAWHVATGQEVKPAVVQKWEYKVMPHPSFSDEEINKLGNEGWELVAAVNKANQTALYLKRPK